MNDKTRDKARVFKLSESGSATYRRDEGVAMSWLSIQTQENGLALHKSSLIVSLSIHTYILGVDLNRASVLIRYTSVFRPLPLLRWPRCGTSLCALLFSAAKFSYLATTNVLKENLSHGPLVLTKHPAQSGAIGRYQVG